MKETDWTKFELKDEEDIRKYEELFDEWGKLQESFTFSIQHLRSIVQNPIMIPTSNVIEWKNYIKRHKEEFNKRFNELTIETLKTIVIGEYE